MDETDSPQSHDTIVDDGRSPFLAKFYATFAGVLLLLGIALLLLAGEPLWYRLGIVATQWIPIYVLFASKRKVVPASFFALLAFLVISAGLLWWSQRFLPPSLKHEDRTMFSMLGILTAIGTFDLHTALKGRV